MIERLTFQHNWWLTNSASLAVALILYTGGWVFHSLALQAAGAILFWPFLILDFLVRSRERRELRETAPVVLVTDGHAAIPLRHPSTIEFGLVNDQNQTVIGLSVYRVDERTLIVRVPHMPEPPKGNQPDQETAQAEQRAYQRIRRSRRNWIPIPGGAHA